MQSLARSKMAVFDDTTVIAPYPATPPHEHRLNRTLYRHKLESLCYISAAGSAGISSFKF